MPPLPRRTIPPTRSSRPSRTGSWEESIVTPDPDTTDTLADATKLFGFCTCDGADNTWRYITFADVAEFVPISYVGSDTYQGDTAVEDGAADEIAADAQERAEN